MTSFLKGTLTLSLLFTMLLFSSTFAVAVAKDPFQMMNSVQFKSVLEQKQPGLMLIDARPVDRYLAGHIKSAVNIPAPELEKTLAQMQVSKNSKLLVYCDGYRCDRKTGLTPDGSPCWSLAAILPTKSGKAAMTLVKMGYLDVSVLMEGFRGWDLQGNLSFRGPDDQQRLETVKLGLQDLKELATEKPGQAIFVDLRHPNEFSQGHVAGAINIPLESIHFKRLTDSLDKSRLVVLYCNWGERSQQAYLLLKQHGFSKLARAISADLEEAGLPLTSR